ncbi:MAG: hypothetical protein ACFFCW_37270 [Candidatus Hodarchaeota archaeon]
MPNTLAHFGIQGLITAAVIRKSDFKWIFLGCVLPDIPWIIRRVVTILNIDVSPYDLMLYAAVQSSLFGSLMLCGALATFSRRHGKIFAILALNSLLHLLLDSLQKKWANGVHLFAPFSWQHMNFGLFWPESLITILLTIAGLGFFSYAWRKRAGSGEDLVSPKGGRLVICIFLLLGYLTAPFALLSGPEAADNFSVRTLRQIENRAGRDVEIDRRPYSIEDGNEVIVTYAKEKLKVEGDKTNSSGIISVRATFLDQKTIQIHEMHFHWVYFRDAASYLGLLMVGLYWMRTFRIVLLKKRT